MSSNLLLSSILLFGCEGLCVHSLAQSSSQAAPAAVIQVDAGNAGHAISPTLYGLMTEEINHSYDGGLYAELIRNRAFKDSAERPVHWSLVTEGGARASITLDRENTANATGLTSSLRLDVQTAGNNDNDRAGVANDGYWGIPAKPDTTYTATLYARAAADFHGPVELSIENRESGSVLAKAEVTGIGTEWERFTTKLVTGPGVQISKNNRLVVSVRSPGTIWLGYVSLFPPTYKGQPNGFRPDLMKLLAAMHPAFLRFPGGNYLEGNTIAQRFDWKKTIGPVEERPGHWCCWGYPSSDGMGLLEFLEWCEDLHIEPVLAVYAGYSLRGEHVETPEALEPFVQDALDEIEYVTGATETKWGAVRAQDGHPQPFHLHYVEIGNEDAFDSSGSYPRRFAAFYRAIKAKYPRLQLISTVGLRGRNAPDIRPDVIDEHYYRSARDMWNNAHQYDNADRNGPKIFVGEWATMEGTPTPNMNAALGDAAWLTGLERNSDIVVMASYAPLFVNVNSVNWSTDLIGYDAESSFGSPSYYAQAMFAKNRGDVVLPLRLEAPIVQPVNKGGEIGVGTWRTEAEFKDIKVTQGDKVLFASGSEGRGLRAWHLHRGHWEIKDGVLQQTSGQDNVRAFIGDKDWRDYTLTLKARKISGAEGFLICFRVQDENVKSWWNIGGWGNTRDAIEMDDLPQDSVDEQIQTGKWYDIRVEQNGPRIRCFLDGKLVHDVQLTGHQPLYATASRDNASGDVILKVVNISDDPISASLRIRGGAQLAPTGECIVLTGERSAQNSIADPDNVVPKEQEIRGVAASFEHQFPARSVNVLRLHPDNR